MTGVQTCALPISLITSDNNVLTGTTTGDDGKFVLGNVGEGTYTLSVSFVGYEEYRAELVVRSTRTDVGDIVLKADTEMLASAKVTERVPLVEMKFDKLVMNVSQLPSAQGSNALDMLKKAPGVYVDKDGNVQLNGNTVAIWIDGRPSNLSGETLATLLKATDATTIDKFEIMEHPSAKYDAEGSGGIINIKTKRNFLKGLSGSIGVNGGGSVCGGGFYPQANGSLNLNYRTDENNVYLTYSPRYQSDYMTKYGKTLFGENYGSDIESWSVYETKELSNVIRVGDDLKLSTKDAVGASVTGTFSDTKMLADPLENKTVTSIGGTEMYRTFSSLNDSSKSSFLTGNAYYTHTFNEAMGEELTLNFDYSYFDSNDDYFVGNYIAPAGASGIGGLDPAMQINLNSQKINIYSGRVDYSTIVFKMMKLETGLKFANTSTGNLSSENAVRNDFNYNEAIAAAYVNASAAFGPKLVFQGGLRYEHTFSDGDWITSGKKTSKNYGHLFPNVMLSYMPFKWRFTLNYSQRVSRPSFSQLNPSTMLMDSQTSIVGNPDLAPQITNMIAFSTGYSQFLNLSAMYISMDDLITQVLTVRDDGYQMYKWDNFGTMQMAGLSASFTQIPITKWMAFTVNLEGLYTKSVNTTLVEGSDYVNEGFSLQAMASLDFTLPKDFTASLSGFGMSTMKMAQYVVDPIINTELSVKKSIMEGRGVISLKVGDLFGTSRANLSYYAPGYDKEPVSRIEQSFLSQRNIVVGFTWNFGSGKPSRSTTHQATEEEQRVLNNTGGVSTGLGGN